MREFYAEANYRLNETHAAAAFAEIIADPRLGYIWLIETEGKDVGHIVVTSRYAMEYGGLIGYLDDLYVRPECRNRGLSSAAIISVREFCRNQGISALAVEVAPDNGPAQTVYRRSGFAECPNRQLLACPLAAPTHETEPLNAG